MKSFKTNKTILKYIGISAFFFLIAGFTLWAIFATNKNCSLAELITDTKEADTKYMILAFAAMLGFILFEGLSLSILVKFLGYKTSFFSGSIYSAADIFCSAVTPSASGGQPASAFFMIKDGISKTQTTVILLTNLVMYSLSLVICGLFTFIFNFSVFLAYETLAKVLIIIGSVVMLLLCSAFILFLTKEKLIYGFLSFFINILSRIKIFKKTDKLTARLDSIVEKYNMCSSVIKGKKRIISGIFIFNLLQRLSHTMVTVFIYLALGGNVSNIFDVGSIQLLTSLGANSFPIPGGIGVTDYLLIEGFKSIKDVDVAAHLALLSRGVSFYSCIIFSLIILLSGCIVNCIRKNKE